MVRGSALRSAQIREIQWWVVVRHFGGASLSDQYWSRIRRLLRERAKSLCEAMAPSTMKAYRQLGPISCHMQATSMMMIRRTGKGTLPPYRISPSSLTWARKKPQSFQVQRSRLFSGHSGYSRCQWMEMRPSWRMFQVGIATPHPWDLCGGYGECQRNRLSALSGRCRQCPVCRASGVACYPWPPHPVPSYVASLSGRTRDPGCPSGWRQSPPAGEWKRTKGRFRDSRGGIYRWKSWRPPSYMNVYHVTVPFSIRSVWFLNSRFAEICGELEGRFIGEILRKNKMK